MKHSIRTAIFFAAVMALVLLGAIIGARAQMQGSEWTGTDGLPGKWTMKCGSIEVVVVLRDYRTDKKVHIYAEQKILNRILSKEIKDNQLYFNGQQCIPIMTWMCPEEREC